MKRYVTDTQCLLWYMAAVRRLPRSARAVFQAVEQGRAQVAVPSIALVEAIFLLQRQRVPIAIVDRLLTLPEEPTATIYVTPLSMAVVIALSSIGPTIIPELADRIIAATALELQLPLLTTDASIIESQLVQVVD